MSNDLALHGGQQPQMKNRHGLTKPDLFKPEDCTKFPEVIFLSLGVKNAGGYPQETNYFVWRHLNEAKANGTYNPKTKYGNPAYVDRGRDIFGIEPEEIEICFVSFDLNFHFDQRHCVYDSRGSMNCYSFPNDPSLNAAYRDTLGAFKNRPCPKLYEAAGLQPPLECPDRFNKKGQEVCKMKGRFSPMIPQITRTGVAVITTSSEVSQDLLRNDLIFAMQVCRHAGGVQDKRFILYRERVEMTDKKSGKRVPHWILRVKLSEQVDRLITHAHNSEDARRLAQAEAHIGISGPTAPPQAIETAEGQKMLAEPETAAQAEPAPEDGAMLAETAKSLFMAAIFADRDELEAGDGIERDQATQKAARAAVAWLKDNGIAIPKKMTGPADAITETNASDILALMEAAPADNIPWRKPPVDTAWLADINDAEIDAELELAGGES